MKRLWTFFTGIEHSVEHILSDFTSIMKRLERHAAAQIDTAYWHQERARNNTEKADAAAIEAAKANAVAGKIKQLIA